MNPSKEPLFILTECAELFGCTRKDLKEVRQKVLQQEQ